MRPFFLDEKLCSFCLGSLMGASTKVPGWIRGKAILSVFGLGDGSCSCCKDIFLSCIDKMLEEALELVQEYEFSSVKSGAVVPPEVIEKLDRLRALHGLMNAESVKLTVTGYLDMELSRRLGTDVSYDPDILLLFDFRRRKVSTWVKPVYVYGRYRKLERGISQSRWICSWCEGKGCEKCEYTGYKYPLSVERLIGEPMKEVFEADDYKIHGAGREDVDVRMLGRGRPFVMEVLNPRRRSVDLGELERIINERGEGKVEVLDLRFADRKEIVSLKRAHARKVYRVKVQVEGFTNEEAKLLEEKLSGAEIRQRTPIRVLRRRADRIRRRKVYEFRVESFDDHGFTATLLCDGGLYIKELISGDEGRTSPSVSELLNKKAKCIELDVMEVLI